MSEMLGYPRQPPGPFRRSFWRSPIRGPWLTSVLGLVLLAGVPVLFVTGLLSYAAYDPGLSPVNDTTPGKGWLGFYLFSWPTHPEWLYRVNQGLHVTLGLVLVPVLLAKLWSVLPRLFEWPPLRSPAHALERLSLFLLVGGGVFEFATGIMNIQQWYVFPGSFYTLHLYGGWVFIAAFAVHATVKFPAVIRALRSRGLLRELRVERRPHPAGAAGCQSPGQPGARGAHHLPARRAGLRGHRVTDRGWRCRSASRSAARCAARPCSPRTGKPTAAGPAASRST